MSYIYRAVVVKVNATWWAMVTVAVALVAVNARADESLVSLRVTRQAAERGRAASVSLVVAPAEGMRILEDGPLTLDLEGPALDASRSLRRQDAVDPRAETPRFEIPLRGKGDGPLRAHLLAWVCRGQRCRPAEITQTITPPISEKP